MTTSKTDYSDQPGLLTQTIPVDERERANWIATLVEVRGEVEDNKKAYLKMLALWKAQVEAANAQRDRIKAAAKAVLAFDWDDLQSDGERALDWLEEVCNEEQAGSGQLRHGPPPAGDTH